MCPRPNREYLLLIYFILDIMNRGKIYRERLSPNYIIYFVRCYAILMTGQFKHLYFDSLKKSESNKWQQVIHHTN